MNGITTSFSSSGTDLEKLDLILAKSFLQHWQNGQEQNRTDIYIYDGYELEVQTFITQSNGIAMDFSGSGMDLEKLDLILAMSFLHPLAEQNRMERKYRCIYDKYELQVQTSINESNL